MDDYQKMAFDISEKNVKNAITERKKNERYQNRFNYYNSIVATLALIISIIAIILEVH